MPTAQKLGTVDFSSSPQNFVKHYRVLGPMPALTVDHRKMSKFTLQQFAFKKPEKGDKDVQMIMKGGI